jgi:L-ascorbate metabolism protein UlaG (beta-lactamase superfamily)
VHHEYGTDSVSVPPSAAPRAITYVGHSTVAITLDGVTLVTDPLLRRRIGHLVRYAPPVVPVTADAVLISHAHQDHLDPPSLAKLGRDTPLIVPVGVAGLLRRRRFRDIREVVPGDRVTIGSVEIEATAADHPGNRPPTRINVESLGYIVRGSRTVYFAGDTGLFPGMARIGDEPIDVALIPIDGWGPKVETGHLDPVGAAEAVRLLRPRIAIPIHWGTYAPFKRPARDPIATVETFASLAGAAARVLAPGERLEV